MKTNDMYGEETDFLKKLKFRPAVSQDCSDLAVFSDVATRKLSSFLWAEQASEGQSSFEVGRESIRTKNDHFTHYKKWQIAEFDGQTVGGLNGYVLPQQDDMIVTSDMPDILQPLLELKGIATSTWYISVAAVHNEARGQGVGTAILEEAMRLARLESCTQLTLMVGSFNTRAHQLYLRMGFKDWTRRSFIPFHGSDQKGDWILMCKNLNYDR